MTRRGGILLEVVLALALFTGAAAFALGAVRSGLQRFDRVRIEQQATDLAKSLLAEMELGRLNVNDLRDGLPRVLGSIENYGEGIEERMTGGEAGWTIDVETQRTEYPGLSLVTLTVREQPAGASSTAQNADAIAVTLRQLIPLREDDVDEWETDELVENLPEDRR